MQSIAKIFLKALKAQEKKKLSNQPAKKTSASLLAAHLEAKAASATSKPSALWAREWTGQPSIQAPQEIHQSEVLVGTAGSIAWTGQVLTHLRQ